MSKRVSLFLFLSLFLRLSNIFALTVIDTFPDVDSAIQPLGEGDGAQLYGQTFWVEHESYLDSFIVSCSTFYTSSAFPLFPNDSVFDFRLLEWNDVEKKVEGSPLYISDPVTIPVEQKEYSYVSFYPHVKLSDVGRYIAVLSVSDYFDGFNNALRFKFVTHKDSYPNGSFFFLVNGSDFSKAYTKPWDDFFVPSDLGFRAEFSPIPEPSTYFLFIIGIIAFLLIKNKSYNWLVF